MGTIQRVDVYLHKSEQITFSVSEGNVGDVQTSSVNRTGQLSARRLR